MFEGIIYFLVGIVSLPILLPVYAFFGILSLLGIW